MKLKKKFNLKDWFFSATPASRLPAKSSLSKVINWFKLPADEYSTVAGRTQRTAPKRFRRGRAWKAGKLAGVERWKYQP